MTISADELRRHLLGLPGVQERETWGHPTFRGADKLIATFAGPATAIVKAGRADQAALIAEEPGTFGVAPRAGRHGWLTVDLRNVRADHVGELVDEAWQATAPTKLLTDRASGVSCTPNQLFQLTNPDRAGWRGADQERRDDVRIGRPVNGLKSNSRSVLVGSISE